MGKTFKLPLENGFAALCAHIKAIRETAEESGSAVSALAESTAASLKEIDDLLDSKIPQPAATTPQAPGTAATGVSTYYARADHVHPSQTSVSGNAGTATKLATSRTIDGVSFNGSAAITHYGTCSTAAATVAKTVSITGFSLVTGAAVRVKFTYANTTSSPTLNVTSTGAKTMRYNNATISSGMLKAYHTYAFVYDGTYWQLVGDVTESASTTKAGIVQLNNTLTSTSTTEALTAAQGKALNDKIATCATKSSGLFTLYWNTDTEQDGAQGTYTKIGDVVICSVGIPKQVNPPSSSNTRTYMVGVPFTPREKVSFVGYGTIDSYRSIRVFSLRSNGQIEFTANGQAAVSSNYEKESVSWAIYGGYGGKYPQTTVNQCEVTFTYHTLD